LNQLISDTIALGAQYRLSQPALTTEYPDISVAPQTAANFQSNSHFITTLHQVNLSAFYNHPTGFFAEAEARWYRQENSGSDQSFSTAPPDTEFWQFDAFAGWRFARRRVEARFGVLNIANQDYRLDPMSLLQELPRSRTLSASFKMNF
jgi:hypothetical protein